MQYLDPLGQSRRVDVPIVTGQRQEIAEQIVRNARLNPVVVTQKGADDDTVGEVVDQDPAANNSVPAGSDVTLTVNAGPDKVVVPKGMIGKDVDDAVTFAKENGFANVRKVAATTEPADAGANQVLSVRPAEGMRVASGTQLTLTYATGKSTIPNVASFPLDQAKKLLNDAGFATLEVQQEENDGVAPDTVLGTTPAAGTQVAKGQKIVIRVAVASQAPASPGPSEQPSAPRSADDDEGDDDPTASPTRGG